MVTAENHHAANLQYIVAAKIGSMCTLHVTGELVVLLTENEASQPEISSIDKNDLNMHISCASTHLYMIHSASLGTQLDSSEDW